MTETDQPRWWQHRVVRALAGVGTTAGLLSTWFLPQDAHWLLKVGSQSSLDLTAGRIELYVGLLLTPFLRKVSYRKRDVALIVLVPLYGEIVAGLVVSRLLSLPRRDWLPREDELPRVVRIPHRHGAYLLPRTFGEAEELRTRWCVNPEHRHPYPDWSAARQLRCTRAGMSVHATTATPSTATP
jgi:hypothetical protein